MPAGPDLRTAAAVAQSGAISRLSGLVHQTRLQPVFVVGRRSFIASGAAQAVRCLFGASADIFSVSDGLPTVADVARFHDAFKPGSFCIVAIGGGHVIDTAKILSLGEPDAAILESKIAAKDDLVRRSPLLAVPTTHGSGSEATPFAVVYINRIKFSVDHPTLCPDAAVLDPDLILSMPDADLASSGLDAIAQAIEAVLSVRGNARTTALALQSLALSWRALPDFRRTRSKPQAQQMLTAAHLAGLAIAQTRTTIPHALSYHLTAYHGLQHGHAVSLSMANYLERFAKACDDSAFPSCAYWSGQLAAICAEISATGSTAKHVWNNYVASLGLPSRLSSISPNFSSHTLAGNINADRFKNSPLDLTPDQATALFS
ncbi:iron-containing alcohol dehydrogenase [Bradyrhizobium sp. CCH5-F6]|jgi:alcohol dehydrogenase|uniref:iron-containing alcohol dehydrogenase n=1 Tax=Bradyrhizobium sp. CCH5-F6 TaxID=1768753 RepID=UPI000A67C1AD|nr:iron-containing alcohol dehydrogenase [Bradyrhizobium sp. CCH5-F6]